jgi:hypothetical protein
VTQRKEAVLPITFRPGRKPNDPTIPRVNMSRHLRAISIPASVNYYTKVPSWGMLGNDEWGDCTCAGDGHIVEQQTYYGSGQEKVVTTGQALDAYSAISGFNPNAGPPGDNPTDNGATVQSALQYLQAKGLAGIKIAMFAELDVAKIAEIKQACYEFGCLSIGVNLPQSAEDQFNNAAPDTMPVWTVVSGSPILGGHCVIVTGYDADYVYLVTWGAVVKATWEWWNTYTEEAWGIVSSYWASLASGLDPAGVNKYTLGAEWAAVTGQKNPFPVPVTPPAPSPAPAPTPVPTPTPNPSPEPPEPPVNHFTLWQKIVAFFVAIWAAIGFGD